MNKLVIFFILGYLFTGCTIGKINTDQSPFVLFFDSLFKEYIDNQFIAGASVRII